MSDLPARTWRRWWLEWPKWFRIGCWAAVGVVILNAALAVRIAVGLVEPAEITNLFADRGIFVKYFWESKPERFHGEHWLLAGIYGKNWSNISVVERMSSDDASFKFAANRFPNLTTLSISGEDVTADGLNHLAHCQRLRRLILARCDLDDDAAAALANLPQVTSLNLSETLITDATLPVLRGMPNLSDVDVSYTDVSFAAIRDWEKSVPAGCFKIDGGTSDLYGPDPPSRQSWEAQTLIVRTQRDDRRDGILGVIRWKDGTRSAGCRGYVWRMCSVTTADGGSTSFSGPHSITRRELFWSTRCWQGNDARTLQIEIAEFESAPVVIPYRQNRPVIEHIEFQMPCTKAEALQPTTK